MARIWFDDAAHDPDDIDPESVGKQTLSHMIGAMSTACDAFSSRDLHAHSAPFVQLL